MVLMGTIIEYDQCVELQQMRYAVAVAETRNFTRAAQQCHVVQSALSQQIGALERELGVRLFARTSRRVELTDAGTAFVSSARECLALVDQTKAETSAAAGVVTGVARLGVIPTLTALDLPAALRRLRADHPDVRVEITTIASDEAIRELRSGALDVAMLGLVEGSVVRGVESRVVVRDRHVAVVSPDHPLATRKRIDLARLAEEPFVDFPTTSPGRAQSEQAYADAGLRRDVPFETGSRELMLDLVRSGQAVALMPSRTVDAADGVVTIPVMRGPRRHEILAWNSFNPTPAGRALRAACEAALRT
jgi:DNA-binding transcriptional LysR family regulator